MDHNKILKYGLPTSLGFLVYFLALEMLGYGDVIYLRLLNAFILLAGVYMGIKDLKEESGRTFSYLRGLRRGVQVTVAAVLPFTIFIGLYLAFINPELMVGLTRIHGYSFNPLTITIALTVEGIASGIGLSYATMQFLKIPREKTAFQKD